MKIHGISKKDNDVLTNPHRATINYALMVASKSVCHRQALIDYYICKYHNCHGIGREIYDDYLKALCGVV